MKARLVSLPRFLWTREWPTKAEMTITGVGKNWFAGRLTRVLNVAGEEAGKERKAGARTMDDGQKIWAFYVTGQRVNGGCALMDTNGSCNHFHMDKFRIVDKEKARSEEGEKVKVAGKRPERWEQ